MFDTHIVQNMIIQNLKIINEKMCTILNYWRINWYKYTIKYFWISNPAGKSKYERARFSFVNSA